MRKECASNEKGFTLVEMMVVVAIVGALAAIAIPNYRKYQNRARQTEAKIALGAIYTAERAFSGENSTYTLCLREAGYNPTGSVRFYAVGFNPTAANSCGWLGDRVCNGYAYSQTAPAPTASYVVNDTTCTIGMGDPANPAISTAYGASARGMTATLNIPMATPDEDTAFPNGPGGCPVAKTTFLGCAGAALEGGNYDRWTITQDGEITNVSSAI